jgi:hypothetical protein
MQNIPHHSLEDIERSREEMAAFMNEKPAYPDLSLSGQDIHAAFCRIAPESPLWENLTTVAQNTYHDLATELNRELDARQSWVGPFEDVTISAIRCPQCNEMLQAEHAEGHACWLEVKPC